MDIGSGRKSKFSLRSLVTVCCLIVGGSALGIVLALAIAPLIRDVCQAAEECQRSLSLLIAVIALTQALNTVVMFLLFDRLRRRDET